MAWFETDWSFTTSEGLEFSGGEVINLGAGGGAFYVSNRLPNSVLRLEYAVLAAGVGVGFPVNIDESTVDMPSVGIGQIMGNNRHWLELSDFEGWCSMAGVQVAAGGGLSVLSVYFHTPVPGYWWGARAWGKIAGTTVGEQAGAGAMFYVGRISRAFPKRPHQRVHNARWD